MPAKPQSLEAAVVAVVEAARKEVTADCTRITIDPQPSGEAPFSVTDPADVLPYAGVAYLSGDSAAFTGERPSGAEVSTGTRSRG